jgi:hypothetical protein
MVFGPKYSPTETPTDILTAHLKKRNTDNVMNPHPTVHPEREWIQPWYKM